MITNYDNLEYLEYAGTNNGILYDFIEYTIDDDDELVQVGRRRLTRREVRRYENGSALLQHLDDMELEEQE